jgi:hypothetical protein
MNNQKKILTGIRLVIGIGLAFGLVYGVLKSTESDLWIAIHEAETSLLLLALFFQGVIIWITSYRWNLLLRVQGIWLRAWDVIRLTMIGMFFNLTLPGSVSGDMVKMAIVTRHAPDKKAEAVLTVLLDRVIGLLGLFIVASVMVAYHLPFLLSLDVEFRPVQVTGFLVGLGSILGVVGITIFKTRQRIMRLTWIARLNHYLAKKLPDSILSKITRLANALDLYSQHAGATGLAVALSILVHSCLAVNLYFIGRSLGEVAIRLRDFFLVVPVSNAIAAIPITPAGIGTRDAVTAIFFKAMQVQGEAVGIIPVTLTLIILFWGLTGGIVFAFSKIPQSAGRLAATKQE